MKLVEPYFEGPESVQDKFRIWTNEGVFDLEIGQDDYNRPVLDVMRVDCGPDGIDCERATPDEVFAMFNLLAIVANKG